MVTDMESDERYLPLSALQHYAYCPRQFALIHVEQAWADNRFTAEGHILHGRVDSGAFEQRRGIGYERGVSLISHRLRIVGKMDLLEVEKGDPPHYFPVEYKRGKPKIEQWDRIQLCAQALCIEEMRNAHVDEGAIWYWEVRRRERVSIDAALRAETISVIEHARSIVESGVTPAPVNDKRCKGCSLVDLCEPATFARDRSARYAKALFDSADIVTDSAGDSG